MPALSREDDEKESAEALFLRASFCRALAVA
jgi:hypothetical protein